MTQQPSDRARSREALASLAIALYEEWRLVDRAARDGDLPSEEALAYNEGLLRALEALSARAPFDVGYIVEQAHAESGAVSASEQESVDESVCPDCGGTRVRAIGSDGYLCPSCD